MKPSGTKQVLLFTHTAHGYGIRQPLRQVQRAVHVFYADPSVDRTFFAMYFPDENNTDWLPPYIITPGGIKVRDGVFYADFQAFPAYKINP